MRGRNYPTIRQFTVFLENRVGQLLDVVRRVEGAERLDLAVPGYLRVALIVMSIGIALVNVKGPMRVRVRLCIKAPMPSVSPRSRAIERMYVPLPQRMFNRNFGN